MAAVIVSDDKNADMEEKKSDNYVQRSRPRFPPY